MANSTKSSMNPDRVYKMLFSSVYPLYVKKAEKKGRTKEEIDEIVCWLTGHTKASLQRQIDSDVDLKTFFDDAPKLNPSAVKITGLICGYRIEDIEDETIRKVRYLDKLIDDLAKGKAMDKILPR